MPGTLRDSIYGLAIGDAIGVPFEFRKRWTFECLDMEGNGTYDQPAGTFSDDTSMAIATCASIKECGGIVPEDMRRKFEEWAYRGAYAIDGNTFDIGNTVWRAIEDGKGQSGEFDNGNGSLMRIAPLAFTDATDAEIEDVSAITHAHEISRRACVIYVNLARRLVDGMPIRDAIFAIDADSPFGGLHRIWKIPKHDISSSGYVVHTLEAALWCLSNTDSYEACILKAVNLGGDTDTTAAVAGALAGIVYGFEGIPDDWIAGLRGRDLIDENLFD